MSRVIHHRRSGRPVLGLPPLGLPLIGLVTAAGLLTGCSVVVGPGPVPTAIPSAPIDGATDWAIPSSWVVPTSAELVVDDIEASGARSEDELWDALAGFLPIDDAEHNDFALRSGFAGVGASTPDGVRDFVVTWIGTPPPRIPYELGEAASSTSVAIVSDRSDYSDAVLDAATAALERLVAADRGMAEFSVEVATHDVVPGLGIRIAYVADNLESPNAVAGRVAEAIGVPVFAQPIESYPFLEDSLPPGTRVPLPA